MTTTSEVALSDQEKAVSPITKEDEGDSESSAAIAQYELMVIINGELREADIKKEIESIEKWIDKNKGKVLMTDVWGKRKLAYRVKQHKEAYYAVFNFELPSDRAQAMNKMLRLEKNVVRTLITLLPKGYVYVNFLKQAEKEKMEKIQPENKVSEVVIEKKETKKKKVEVKTEETEKKSEKPEEPVDKNLDAKLDKILGGDINF